MDLWLTPRSLWIIGPTIKKNLSLFRGYFIQCLLGKPFGWLILPTRIQRLSEIVDQIVDVFNAHRHPDQSSGDPERRALDRDQLAVGRASGKAGECFHTAKTEGGSGDLEPAENAARIRMLVRRRRVAARRSWHTPHGGCRVEVMWINVSTPPRFYGSPMICQSWWKSWTNWLKSKHSSHF